MKKILIAALAAVAVLCAGLLGAQEAQGPRIEVREATFDFGKVVQGSVVNHVFEVRNAGDATLVIDRVVPS